MEPMEMDSTAQPALRRSSRLANRKVAPGKPAAASTSREPEDHPLQLAIPGTSRDLQDGTDQLVVPRLNDDCLREIFDYLPFEDRLRLQGVNWQWHDVGQQFTSLDAKYFTSHLGSRFSYGKRRGERGEPPEEYGAGGQMLCTLEAAGGSVRRLDLRGFSETDNMADNYLEDLVHFLSGLSEELWRGIRHVSMTYEVMRRMRAMLPCQDPETCRRPQPPLDSASNHQEPWHLAPHVVCLLRKNLKSLALHDFCFAEKGDAQWLALHLVPGLHSLEMLGSKKFPWQHPDEDMYWEALYQALSPELRHLSLIVTCDQLYVLLQRLRQRPGSLAHLTSLKLTSLRACYSQQCIHKNPDTTQFLSAIYKEYRTEPPHGLNHLDRTGNEWLMLDALCLLLAPQLTSLEVELGEVDHSERTMRYLKELHIFLGTITSLRLYVRVYHPLYDRNPFSFAHLAPVLRRTCHLRKLQLMREKVYPRGLIDPARIPLCDLGEALSGLTELRELRVNTWFMCAEALELLPASLRTLRFQDIAGVPWEELLGVVRRCPALHLLDGADSVLYIEDKDDLKKLADLEEAVRSSLASRSFVQGKSMLPLRVTVYSFTEQRWRWKKDLKLAKKEIAIMNKFRDSTMIRVIPMRNSDRLERRVENPLPTDVDKILKVAL